MIHLGLRKFKSIIAFGLVILLSACNKSRFGEYYDKKVKQFEEENKTLTEVDVAFVGDSITDLYPVEEFFTGYKVANRGIGGDTTTGLINRLKVSVYDINPKVIYTMIGINNYKTMFNDYEKILQGYKENLPESKVIGIPEDRAQNKYNS